MVIIVYLAIVLASVTQSASTKAFNRQSDNSTVFNATKAVTSFALFALMAVKGFTFHLPTLFFGLCYGACMCVSMYSGYKALCLGPMALTSMLVSFSIIVPLIWGLTVGDETLSPLRIIALILLFGAIILTNADKIFTSRQNKESGTQKSGYGLWLLFVGTTFMCNGVCSVLQKQHQSLYPEAFSNEFMFFAMLLCTLIFVTILLLKNSREDIKKVNKKWLGALSGLGNGLVGFFTLILAGFENATVLFPVISAGTLLSVILCGRFLFKEKLKINHYFALPAGMLAVVFLKL